MKDIILKWLFLMFGIIMGALGGIILFNFSYAPYNFDVGATIGIIVASIYLMIKTLKK